MNAPSPALQSMQAEFAAQTHAGAQRQRAFADFLALGFPTAKVDTWKYTDLRRLAMKQFRLAKSTDARTDASLLATSGSRLVFVDGHLASSVSQQVEGVAITMPASVVPLGTDPFDLLNAAFSAGTVQIEVQSRRRIEAPIYVAFIWTKSANGLMAHPRMQISIRDGANATLIEHHVGEGAGNFYNSVLNVEVGQDAVLQHVRIQADTETNFNIGATNANVARGGSYTHHQYVAGGGLSRVDLVVRLLGEEAHAELHGLVYAHSTQHLDVRTCIEHTVPNTRSREDYRGVADHRGRVVFNGKVIVAKDAQRTDAAQSSRNLLLSPQAEIDTRPELEIYANDVKCAHGATVGQLDATALFYLRSRGIDHNEARALLTQAFTTEIVERIPVAPVREHVLNQLSNRMRSGSAQ